MPKLSETIVTLLLEAEVEVPEFDPEEVNALTGVPLPNYVSIMQSLGFERSDEQEEKVPGDWILYVDDDRLEHRFAISVALTRNLKMWMLQGRARRPDEPRREFSFHIDPYFYNEEAGQWQSLSPDFTLPEERVTSLPRFVQKLIRWIKTGKYARAASVAQNQIDHLVFDRTGMPED